MTKTTPKAWQRLDVVVALAIFAGFTTPALLGFPDHNGSPPAVVLFGAGAALPLMVRRRWPLAVLAVVVASTALGTVLGVRFTPLVSNAGLGVGLAMYTVAERFGRRVISVGALVGAVAVSWGAVEIAAEVHPQQDHNAVNVITAVTGWVIGDFVRLRRSDRAAVADQRRAELEERQRRAIAEERLRISREVHDVVSHSLSVIVVQAGVGRMVFETQPDQARAALSEVESLSRGALDELRRLVAGIREGGSGDDALAPMPGLDDLPELARRITASGVEVSLDLPPPDVTLLPMVALSVYRIVQEALTNVVKHAPGTKACVEIHESNGELSVMVVNEDPVPPRPPTGFYDEEAGWGLAGMAERVAFLGGGLDTALLSGGGFRVLAKFPIDGQSNGSSR